MVAIIAQAGTLGPPALLASSSRKPQALLKSFPYGYDPAGNRLFEQIDDRVTAWTYDRFNRLVTEQAAVSAICQP